MQALWLWLFLSGQLPGTDDLDKAARSLERGGLYSIIVILALALAYMFLLKERQRKELHTEFQTLQKASNDKLLSVVEQQSSVMTKQALLTEKVESLLTRVTARLEARKED